MVGLSAKDDRGSIDVYKRQTLNITFSWKTTVKHSTKLKYIPIYFYLLIFLNYLSAHNLLLSVVEKIEIAPWKKFILLLL